MISITIGRLDELFHIGLALPDTDVDRIRLFVEGGDTIGDVDTLIVKDFANDPDVDYFINDGALTLRSQSGDESILLDSFEKIVLNASAGANDFFPTSYAGSLIVRGLGDDDFVDWASANGPVIAEYGIPQWQEVGPGVTLGDGVDNIEGFPVAGAIQTIALHPNDDSIAYIGSVNGGIWRTNNWRTTEESGPHWEPLTDEFPSLAISDIVFSPTNADVIYAGTGTFSNHISFPRSGDAIGLLRSVDGGASWEVVGQRDLAGKQIWSVAVTGNDPNSEIVLVATGDGLYRSTDSGANFIKVEEGSPPGPTNSAEPVLPDGAATDVIVANGGIIYAAIAGEGIFRSTNDGVAWNLISRVQDVSVGDLNGDGEVDNLDTNQDGKFDLIGDASRISLTADETGVVYAGIIGKPRAELVSASGSVLTISDVSNFQIGDEVLGVRLEDINAQQHLIPDNASGPYTLTLGSGSPTEPIPLDASAQDIEDALNATLPGEDNVSVIDVSFAGLDGFFIEFRNDLGGIDVPLLTSSDPGVEIKLLQTGQQRETTVELGTIGSINNDTITLEQNS